VQQIQKGINDSFVRFVYFLKRNNDFKNENSGSMGRQLLAFVKGTEIALLKNKRSFITTSFEKCDMFNIGMMISLEEHIVTFLGSFKEINAYDQPGVQDGKLSALNMDKISKHIEEYLKKKFLKKKSFFGKEVHKMH